MLHAKHSPMSKCTCSKVCFHGCKLERIPELCGRRAMLLFIRSLANAWEL